MNFLLRLSPLVSFLFIQATWASPENDRVFQLETIAWLKPQDNTDGIFIDYIDTVYSKYFKKQGRFVVKALPGLERTLESSSIRYPEVIQNKDLLRKVGQQFKVETLIRTKIFKEADTYRFVIEWVYAPKGDVLSSSEFRYFDPKNEGGLKDSDLPNAIEQALDEMISKLPFLGQVTGVDGEMITVNLGRNQKVFPRQTFVIYTLDEVKRHPLLNTIEEWKWRKVGRAEVVQVEESLSFAKIVETASSSGENETVIRFQKIRQVLPAPPLPLPQEMTGENEDESLKPKKKELPRIGWVAGNIGLGSYSREVNVGSGQGKAGGGFLGSFELEGFVWLTSRWLAQASLAQSLFNYSPQDLATSVQSDRSYSGTGSQVRLAAGYSFIPAKTIFDPIAWAHLGYRYTAYSLPVQTVDYTASSSFGSLFLGFGGEVPIADRFALQLNFDMGLLKSGSSDDLGFGTATSATDLSFTLGGTYLFEDRFYFRLLFEVNSQSMDFSTGQSLTQKTFSVAPSVMYYF